MTELLRENKALVRRQFEELINRRNLSVVEEDIAGDFVDHEAPPGTPPGPVWVKHWIRTLFQVVPDLHVTIEDIFAEDDRVVVRNTWRGTHTGLFLGLEPTGRKFVLKGIVIWRIADGRLKERWAALDQLGVIRQLHPEGCRI
ncbi:MAG TPA: ester cyclase [Blastocatellia bacterium]|nr:ester cyclase [Blastocatellia bacterium]